MKKEYEKQKEKLEKMIEIAEERGYPLKGETSEMRFRLLKLDNFLKPCRFVEQEWQGIDNYGETTP